MPDKSRTRIVIIGAGSLGFSSRLTADLLSYERLQDSHFALVDVNRERLTFAGQIIERIFSEGGYDSATFSLHEQRREALVDANFVISSILVGGYDAIEKEIDIPMRYGVSQAIGDTLTPGGIMRCLRTLPVQTGIARDIAELSPDAYLLNYTNPMSMLCWGMVEAVPEIKLVGARRVSSRNFTTVPTGVTPCKKWWIGKPRLTCNAAVNMDRKLSMPLSAVRKRSSMAM